MKDIVLSIHPKWAQKIYSGEKTIEWRKNGTHAGTNRRIE